MSAHLVQALLSSLKLSQDLFNATAALVSPPQGQPEEVKATGEQAASCWTLGIWMCISFAFSLSALCIYGISLLIKRCKTWSTDSQRPFATLSPRRPAATVQAPQSSIHALARPNFQDTRSSVSTCSSTCGSLRDHRPPLKQPELIQNQIKLPPPLAASRPSKGDFELQPPLTIAQLCHQQYAHEQKCTDSPLPPTAGSSKSQTHGFLKFWRHS